LRISSMEFKENLIKAKSYYGDTHSVPEIKKRLLSNLDQVNNKLASMGITIIKDVGDEFVVLIEKLEENLEVFEKEILDRQEVARRYNEGLKGCVTTPSVPNGYRSAWAQYSVLSDNREQLIDRLKKAGVPTAIYYPKPLHLQGAFENLGYTEGNFHVSEELSKRIFSLPMHGYLGSNDQSLISKAAR